jgi:rubredoxin
MPIDQMKLEDGYPADFANEECPHLFKCPDCGASKVYLIKE